VTAVASLLVAAVVAATQVTVQRPQELGDPSRPVGTMYPEAVDVPLSAIWASPESFRNRHVRTRGFVDVLQPGRYYQLSEGPARLLLIVPHELLTELDRRAGSEVDARGIVRQLRKKEYTKDGIDIDLIEHPDLPVLPPPGPELPTYSLTVLGFAEREGRPASRTGATAGTGSAAALLANPPARGKKQRVVLRGQFRGRNLFGELPAASRRRPSDWVLKDGETALWVTGKEPRGKGWTLDPDYEGDTVRWLEVAGEAEVVGGVLYLDASKLDLVKPPQRAADEQDP
jgi:hypothetical protein